MVRLLEIGLTNAVLATVLAIAVLLVTRVWRNPVLAQLLWVVVLLKLVSPPLVGIPWQLAADAGEPQIAPALDLLGGASRESIATDELSGGDSRSVVVSPRFDSIAAVASNGPIDATPVALAEPVTSSPAFQFHWSTAIIVVWLSGSTVWFVFALWRVVRFQRALAHTAAAPEEIQRWADEVAAKLGVGSGYRVRMTEGRLSPLVWPVGRPTIVLSRPFIEQLSPVEVQSLLAHEFAHLRRKDHWVRWLELAVATIYWWHPVVWWARRMIERAEERACDAWAVWAFPNAVQQYATALFKSAQFASEPRQPILLVASRLTSGGDLAERIENVINGTWNCRLGMPVRLAVVALALLVVPLSLRADSADEDALALIRVAEKEVAAMDADPIAARDDTQRIRPGMILRIRTVPALTDDWGNTVFEVEPGGAVALGPEHGRIQVAGLTIAEAEAELVTHLARTLTDPKVQVTVTNREAERERVELPADPYHIAPGDVVIIRAVGALPDAPIADEFLVEPSGAVALGPNYGRVKIAGKTLEESEDAITQHMQKTVEHPIVQVTLGGWQNRSRPADESDTAFIPHDADRRVALKPTRASAQRSDERSGRANDEAQILSDHIKFLEEQFKKIDALYQSGAQGGSAERRESAAYELALANGELARVWGQQDKAVAQFEEARAHADETLKAYQAAYAADRVTFDQVLLAANNLASVRRKLIEVQSDADAAPRGEAHAVQNAKAVSNLDLARKLSTLDSTGSSTASIGYWKKAVESRRADCARMEQLRDQKVVTAAEMARVNDELDRALESLRQAEQARDYRGLLVELAEAEYEEARNANLQSPQSVSQGEIKRRKILLEMAKAKVRELEE